MFLYKFISNKKANTETRVGLFFFSFCTVKTFKYFYLLFFVNTNTIILYSKRNLAIWCLADKHIDLIIVRRIFNRICQKIDHRLPYPVFICKYISLKIVV